MHPPAQYMEVVRRHEVVTAFLQEAKAECKPMPVLRRTVVHRAPAVEERVVRWMEDQDRMRTEIGLLLALLEPRHTLEL